MATIIVTKNGTTGTPSGLADGELAVDRVLGKLWVGNAGNPVPIQGQNVPDGNAEGDLLEWVSGEWTAVEPAEAGLGLPVSDVEGSVISWDNTGKVYVIPAGVTITSTAIATTGAISASGNITAAQFIGNVTGNVSGSAGSAAVATDSLAINGVALVLDAGTTDVLDIRIDSEASTVGAPDTRITFVL